MQFSDQLMYLFKYGAENYYMLERDCIKSLNKID